MKRFSGVPMTPSMAARMLADAVMVNAAWLVGLTLRYLWWVGIEARTDVSPRAMLNGYVEAYLNSFWLLTLISLVIGYASGFYTHARFYRERRKAPVIARAVILSYIVFALFVLLLWDVTAFPLSALLPAWALTLAFLMGARLWARLWRLANRVERRVVPAPPAENIIEHVLVTGGAGYIGSALLPKLLERGYHVRLLDLLLYGTEPIRSVLNHPRLEIMQADFLQADKVIEAMSGVDAVIHLGAIVGDPACALDEGLTIEVNLMATRLIAEVAKCMGVKRLIFASTCSVYGASDGILDERSALNPISLYARSKVASEKVLMNMADDHFDSVFLRFATIYGISGRARFDLVINLLAAKAIVDGQITVLGGDQWRPFVHVDDAALAIVKVLETPRSLVRHQVFNVGSNEQNYTIQQAAEIVHRLVPTAELINKRSDADRRNYRVDFSKIRRTIGFAPQWTIERGVQQIIAAIETGRIRDYRDPQYSNVAFLSAAGMSCFVAYQNGQTYDLLNETIARLAYDRPFSPGESRWPFELIVLSDPLNRRVPAA